STLVYFATSLNANSGVLNRLTRYTRLEQYPDDQELLDDLIVENRDYKKPKRDSFAIRQASSLSQKEIWTIIIASPLLAAAIMYNAHLNHYEGVMYYFMLFISIVALAYGILHIYILIIKKNQEL
ncbi:MAG: hypothetical protein IIT44_08315, partial [Erysipelotrichaceae bacterium]|nr:hypothetical protein [Erysipelotrichaceae bacterium]